MGMFFVSKIPSFVFLRKVCLNVLRWSDHLNLFSYIFMLIKGSAHLNNPVFHTSINRSGVREGAECYHSFHNHSQEKGSESLTAGGKEWKPSKVNRKDTKTWMKQNRVLRGLNKSAVLVSDAQKQIVLLHSGHLHSQISSLINQPATSEIRPYISIPVSWDVFNSVVGCSRSCSVVSDVSPASYPYKPAE